MRYRATDAAAATGGLLHGDDVELDGASFDSRELRPGQLFVPLVAERDGHDFIPAAVAAGAAAYLTSRGPHPAVPEVAAIAVADTGAALVDLATWATPRLGSTVVGITGSVGKTSTKDLAAAAIGAARRVVASERSFNNEQGLPVTVLNAPEDTEVLVLEMGMRGFGEIARLCTVAPPTIGIVTAVAAAHTGRLGGIDGVAKAKAELVEALPPDGVAILNADDPRVLAMSSATSARIVTFGESPDADVRASDVTVDNLARPSFRLESPWGNAAVTLATSGRHMVTNALAALAAAGVLGVDLAAAAAAVGRASLSPSRMAVHRLASGAVLIDDAYNANPASMRAALDALAALPAHRRIAVLGLMAELDDPAADHVAIREEVAARGIELIAVGTELYGVAPADEPIAAVGPLAAGTAVLVKASRIAELDRLARRLIEAADPARPPEADG